MKINKFRHIDDMGTARMVDVTGKADSRRRAVAIGEIQINSEVLASIKRDDNPKGDVLSVSRVAGIMAAKKVDQLVPLCQTLPLDTVNISFHLGNRKILCRSAVTMEGKTAVEMEALTAVSIALLTIYDMCKAVDKGMVIGNISLLEKSGGRSGHFKGRLPADCPEDMESEWR